MLHAVTAQVDRLIQVQPAQAQALNSQLPPGFMYVPAACLPADYQASLQLQTPPLAKLTPAPAVLPASVASGVRPASSPTASAPLRAGVAAESRAGTVANAAGGSDGPQQTSGQGPGGVIAVPVRAGILPVMDDGEPADPPDTAADDAADEDYEPLAAPAGSRARGLRDKTPRRPRTGEAARAGAARLGKRGKRA